MKEKEVRNEKDDPQGKALPEVMLPIIAQLKVDRKYAAAHVYRSVLRSVGRFAGNDIPVDALFQPGMLKAYENWLRGSQASWSTVSTYVRTLRAAYNRVVPPGTVGHNPKLFEDVHTKVDSYTKRALTEEQMQTLMEADITKLPQGVQCALAYSLLMFLFRGMAYIDLTQLQKGDVRGNFITYCRHKTGRQITVRIPPEAMPLLEEFRNTNPDSIYLFPILDAPTGNRKRRTDEELYQDYLRALRSFNKKLARIAALLLPGTKLSSYTSRHTWATLAYYNNVNIGIISKALGHSSIKVTENYLKPFNNEKVDSVNDELISSVLRSKQNREVA